jgi:hypothetical protein
LHGTKQISQKIFLLPWCLHFLKHFNCKSHKSYLSYGKLLHVPKHTIAYGLNLETHENEISYKWGRLASLEHKVIHMQHVSSSSSWLWNLSLVLGHQCIYVHSFMFPKYHFLHVSLEKFFTSLWYRLFCLP